MRRAAPYLLFGLVTLSVFWGFLRHGHTLYNVGFVETTMGGKQEPAPPGRLFAQTRIVDNILLLPFNLRVYNEGLKAGELRLWNPYLFCGYPLYADPMVHPFYPPHLILHGLFPPTIAYEISLMLHLFFAGAAMFWAARALRMSEAGATVAGLGWMLFGYNALWFSSAILLGVSVFFPLALRWALLGIERKEYSFAPRAALALGLMILGSHPQHALHFFLFLGAWIALAAWRDRESRSFVLRFGASIALLSIGVALVELLARADTILHGFRKVGPDMRDRYGDPWALLGQAAGLGIGRIMFHGNTTVKLEFNVFAGIALLTLAVTGAVRAFKEPVVRFVSVFAAASFLVAFLRPLAELAQLVPGLNLSPPARWLSVFGFCLALLAGRGLDSMAQEVGRIPRILAAGCGLFVLLCVARIGPLTFANPQVVLTLAGMFFAVLAAFYARRDTRIALVLTFVALLADLRTNFVACNPHMNDDLLRHDPEPVRIAKGLEAGPWRATGQFGGLASIYANNVLSLYGLETLGGFEAIIPSHYVRFAQEAGATRTETGRALAFSRLDSPLLDVAGLRFLFLQRDIPAHERFPRVGEHGAVNLYENPKALPRAYMVSGAILARDEEQAASLLRDPAFRPRESVVLETSEALPGGPPGAVGCDVRWIERTSDRLRLEVEAGGDGYLVLSDTDYPGWVAEVDGQRAPIHRANLAFRALKLAPGRHEVEFRFRPASVRWGLSGSLLAVVLAVGWIALRCRRAARTPA